MSFIGLFVLALAFYGAESNEIVSRVLEGDNDSDHRYPYVGTFIIHKWPPWSFKNIRGCTGSIITLEWVLTAGHCVQSSLLNVHFAYGDLSIPLNKSDKIKKVIRGVTSFYDELGSTFKNDIGLAMIEPVRLNTYAKISSLDYNSLIGYAVEYAGAGGTYSQAVYENKKLWREALGKDQTRPLQIGHGVVAKCNKRNFYPAICIRPKCRAKKQRVQFADSGGPLFHNGKIIAVTSNLEDDTTEIILVQFTPVSPFLDWIEKTVNTKRVDD